MMRQRGILLSESEIEKRRQILLDLQEVIHFWIESGHRRGKAYDAVIIPYGSYGLKVFNKKSDVDVLVVAPSTVCMETDFFVHLRDVQKTTPGVSDLRSITLAKVPLLKFKVHEVNVDLACAQLRTTTVPRPEMLHQQNFCLPIALSAQDRLALESVKSNWVISRCLGENTENFVHATLFLKDWADRRGVYGNMYCYLGGVHLTVMVTYICQTFRRGSIAGIISQFFETFSGWSWGEPVVLDEDLTWSSPALTSPILIQKPGSDAFCQSNVTQVTLMKICNELDRGYNLTKVLSSDWMTLLERFPYEIVYTRFLKVRIYVTDNAEDADIDEWVGFVKSRIPRLILLLESNGIKCDPSSFVFRDLPPSCRMDNKSDNRVFLWGIVCDRGKRYDLTGPESNWQNNLTINSGGLRGQVKLAIIPQSVYARYMREAMHGSQL